VGVYKYVGPQLHRGMFLTAVKEQFNAFQVKRRSGGGALFSRDPLNLANRQTPKHSGFLNAKVRPLG
jgi:hypothetical protein